MERHVKILGVLNIVWGSLTALAALILLIVFGGALGVLGMVSREAPDARLAMPVVGFVGGLLVFVLLVASAPSIIAGIGLVRFAPWSRILGIVVSVLHLFSIPFGTVLGIYGLWTLLSKETPHLFAETHRPPIRI